MNYKEFFTTDNKSGWKTRENILKKSEPNVYAAVIEFSNKNSLFDLSFKQQIWHFINNEPNRKKCLGCGGDVEFRDSLLKGYRKFCSLPCANQSGLLDDLATSKTKEKWGVSYFTQHNTFSSKVKKTKKDRYGNESYNNLEKALLTKEKLYGDKNFNNKNKSKITLREFFLKQIVLKTSDELVKYDIEDTDITLKCNSCGLDYQIYNTLFNYRTEYNIKLCTRCNPINSTDSYHQKELYEFIKELSPYDVLKETRKVIPPFELDVYIPELKIAIEFDGLYWHSNKFVENNYHLKKTKLCEVQGIQLIHVFEDEWIYKKDIIKSVLKSKILTSNNIIYARKCIIKEVSSKDCVIFLNNNHIQGSVNSKYRFGLYYKDELVSLMSFGNLRKSLGSNSLDGNFELLRFANKLNTNVVGGFSKLLNTFIKIYNPSSILTFSDNRYFSGNVYKNNNFNFILNTKPNYWYIVGHKRHHRFKYRKDVLIRGGFDKNKSESKIMSERGINRIYDCGNKKWLLTL